MGVSGGHNDFGYFSNGDFTNGNNYNFTWGSYVASGGPNNGAYIEYTGYGGGKFSDNYVEVDTSEKYQMIVQMKTIQRGTDGNLAGGHIGFACFDKYKNFIDLRNCGDVGNAYLTRDLNPGDDYAYINTSSDWYIGEDVTNYSISFRHFCLYPSTHPFYNNPYEYTRIGYGDVTICYKSMIQTVEGDWKVKLCDYSNTDITFPNIGYSTPSGTPISRGQAGGSYNYALGAPYYPEEWTTYKTESFTGENRNSGIPFRYATKYIKFMILTNYNNRNASVQDHKFGLSNVFFTKVLNNKTYENYF